MLQIERSVGAAGANQIHDVATVQLMLKLLYRGSGAGGPYYRGNISGKYDVQTSAAIRDFFLDTYASLSVPEQQKVNSNFPVFEPVGLMFKQLASFLVGNRVYREGSVIKGTNIGYIINNNPKFGYMAGDYLISAYATPKRVVRIGGQDFIAKYERAYLTLHDHFALEVSLPQIASFIDGNSSQPQILPVSLTKAFKDLIAQNYQGGEYALSEGEWGLSAKPAMAGLYVIVGKGKTGLLETIKEMEKKKILRRVLYLKEGSKYGYVALIPSLDEIEKIASDIQMAVCAGQKVVGTDFVVNARVASLAKKILKNSPNANEDAPYIHCSNCANYKKIIDRESENIERIKGEFNSPSYSDLVKELKYNLQELAKFDGSSLSEKLHGIEQISLATFLAHKKIPLSADKILRGEFPPVGLTEAPDIAAIGTKKMIKVLVAKGLEASQLVKNLVTLAGLFEGVGEVLLLIEIVKTLKESGLLSYMYRHWNPVEIVKHYNLQVKLSYFLERVIPLTNRMRLELENSNLVVQQASEAMLQQKCGDGYF